MAFEADNVVFGPESTAVGRAVSDELARARPARPLAPGLAAQAREKLAGLSKYVTEAVVAPQGGADVGSFMPVVRRLAAAGLVAGFAILVPDSEAQAWGRPYGAGYAQSYQPFPHGGYGGYRGHRRDRQTGQLVAAGIGLVGGLLLGGSLGGGALGGDARGYGYGGGYGYVPPQPLAQPMLPRQAYGGYAPPPAYGGYGPVGPSDGFILSAKSLIAAKVRSTDEADRIFDRFLRQAQQCTLELGPSAQCVVRFQEVTLDLGRGQFSAAMDGIPVVTERQGHLNRLRPDILQNAIAEARLVNPLNNGYGRY